MFTYVIFLESMIGDTNLFFLSGDITIIAELEIMIAEKWARGKHCGQESTFLMLHYGITRLNVKHFVVKITTENTASIEMFRKIGFIETERSEVFKEVTMEKIVDVDWFDAIENNLGSFEILPDSS